MIDIIKPEIVSEEVTDNSGVFVVEPIERGFGHTLGNSLRRILLSSLPGAAVTWIRVDGVPHEFTSMKGTLEDVTDIILNIKQLVFKLESDEPAIVKLDVSGPKAVTAADISLPADVEVINDDAHIMTLNSKSNIKMELQVEKGLGYISADKNKRVQQPIGVIPVDSLFCPTLNVSYAVENTRVGQRTDYDKLILRVKTNGSISPKKAVGIASKIMNEHMNLFTAALEDEAISVFSTEGGPKDQSLNVPIEQLDLSVRSYNCLKRQAINSLQDLIGYSEQDLMNIRNFGAKSIDEIKDKLAQLDLALKGQEVQ